MTIKKTTSIFLYSILSALTMPAQTVCYSQYSESKEKGYIGEIHGTKLFFEVWTDKGPGGTAQQSILIWKTMKDLDSIDFCFQADYADSREADSIHVTIRTSDATGREFKTTSTSAIPGLFQILKQSEVGVGQYSGLRNSGEGLPKIYIKGDQLYLTYLYNPRYDTAHIETEIYDLSPENKFVLRKKPVPKPLK